MFDSTVLDQANGQRVDGNDEAIRRQETPEEAHSRLVREATEALSNIPGKRGRLLRRALASGWC